MREPLRPDDFIDPDMILTMIWFVGLVAWLSVMAYKLRETIVTVGFWLREFV